MELAQGRRAGEGLGGALKLYAGFYGKKMTGAAQSGFPGAMKRLVAAMLALISIVSHAEEMDAMESRKIEYLIASIETLENAEFIRNGRAHDAGAAADHLRLKLRKAGSRVKTAQDFIRYCATGSSMSGKPYQIRFADGRTVATGEYLRQQLDGFEAAAGK